MTLKSLEDFTLVGGTALSLKYGHRLSVDLDIFGSNYNSTQIIEELTDTFGDRFNYRQVNLKVGIFGFISGIKVDIVNYQFPLIDNVEKFENIRLSSDADSAMKIQAVLGRGRKKDFWDIARLLKEYRVADMIQWHHDKYPSQMLAISIPHALTYFDDADQSEDPISLNGQTWESVKSFISEKTRDYLA